MPTRPHHTPEEIAHARILYEETDVSPHDVARVLGIGTNTFYRRVKLWGWRRRRLRVAEVDAMAVEAAASRDAELAALGGRVIDDKRASIDRAEAAIMGQVAALEQMQERVALAAITVLDGERAGRALHRLARALVEVGRFRAEAAKAAPKVGRVAADDPDGDMEALRETLRRRIDALRAGG